jgi:hypothetical protein
LLGVLILLAVTPNATMPLFDAQSAKTPAEFGACFAQAQERSAIAWAFLSSEQGGTFTDSGAHGAPATYWLQVHGTSGPTRVRLFTPQGGRPSPKVAEAVEQCR